MLGSLGAALASRRLQEASLCGLQAVVRSMPRGACVRILLELVAVRIWRSLPTAVRVPSDKSNSLLHCSGVKGQASSWGLLGTHRSFGGTCWTACASWASETSGCGTEPRSTLERLDSDGRTPGDRADGDPTGLLTSSPTPEPVFERSGSSEGDSAGLLAISPTPEPVFERSGSSGSSKLTRLM